MSKLQKHVEDISTRPEFQGKEYNEYNVIIKLIKLIEAKEPKRPVFTVVKND